MKYRVELSAEADMSTIVEVEAASDDAAAAAAKKIAISGDAEWSYEGVQRSTIEVVTVDSQE